MADLDFSRNVPAVGEGEKLPQPYQRSERPEISSTPNYQNTINDYAASSNWMSRIGATVASKASNAIAQKIGGELGKNPQGDIGIPITDFDKTMQESYLTQAQATLGLQADKLITDSNIEVAKADRITPDLIAKTNKSISIGLQNIFKNAPPQVLPNLQKVYGASQLSLSEHLTNRMIQEQHEDTVNNTILSNNQNAETAHSLSASGKFDAADLLVKNNTAKNNATAARNIGFTPQQAKVGSDTVRQSAIAGKLQFQYDQAVKEKKEADFVKNLATRPSWISDADYPTAMQSLTNHINMQNSLKSNYEELTMTDFKGRMETDIGSITGSDLQSTLDKLSPLNASKLNNEYIAAYKKQKQENEEQSNLIQHWDNATVHANASEKIKNKTFNGKVNYVIANSPNTSREEAENQVASSAGGTIPVFTQTLKTKLRSGDPNDMVSAAKQISELQESGNGKALGGLSDEDKALASDIKHNYNPADPASAARIIAENKQNQDNDFRRDSEAAFANKIYQNTIKVGKDADDYILGTFGLGDPIIGTRFDTPWNKAFYASDIRSNYRTNFINTGRDDNRAQLLTKDYVKNNYGKTSINGSSEWTLHPIEKACGFPEGEGITTINKDIVRQLTGPMLNLKKLYDDKKSDEYWSIEPVEKEAKVYTTFPGAPAIQAPGGPTIERLNLVKHTRNGAATDTHTYPLRLVGNNFNWEINGDTANGPASMFLLGPILGVHTYTPDVEWIKANANK